jgi:hypothetical protein
MIVILFLYKEMILEDATKEAFNYYSYKLPRKSSKPIIAVCELCGKFKVTSKNNYRTFCKSCSPLLASARKGKNHHMFGKEHTEEAKALISGTLKGNTNTLGCKRTDATKALMSAARKGEKNGRWLGGISFEPYCIKFNDEYKEHVRNLFGDECFLCSLSEADNGRKLCVHHVNYNKDCGCDETRCICVPLCMPCHVKTNYDRDYYQALIMEMLRPIKAWSS